MKREIIKDEIHEDGTHTKIEKFTQTPEDGFVYEEQRGTLRRKKRFFKGHAIRIRYQSNDPKVVYPALLFMFLAVMLIFLIVAGLFFFTARFLPYGMGFIKTYFFIIFLFIVFIFGYMFKEMRKIQKKREKEMQNQQNQKDQQ